MQISTNQIYKHSEIRSLFSQCPACGLTDEFVLWSSMSDMKTNMGKEGVSCARCKLNISFSFKMNQDSEIIDEYVLDFFKLGRLEFKNNDKQLVLYLNNTYVQDIENNIVDLNKCKILTMIS